MKKQGKLDISAETVGEFYSEVGVIQLICACIKINPFKGFLIPCQNHRSELSKIWLFQFSTPIFKAKNQLDPLENVFVSEYQIRKASLLIMFSILLILKSARFVGTS